MSRPAGAPWIAAATVLVVTSVGFWTLNRPPAAEPIYDPSGSGLVSGPALAAAISGVLNDARASLPEVAGLPSDARGLAYVALRVDAVRVAAAWGEAASPSGAVADAVGNAMTGIDAAQRSRVNSVEIAVAGRSLVAPTDAGSVGDNLDRGVLGMAVTVDDGEVRRFSPTEMIADNTSFDRVVERLYEDGELAAESLPSGRVEVFNATQLLVDLERSTVVRLDRGNELVPAGSVTRETTDALGGGMADWLVRQLGKDGRMVYEYWPSRGEESTSNNMIRQWMATRALTRVAAERNDPELLATVERNIAFNLELSYREEDGLGLIADPDGDVKLGAVALAALAISEHPARERFASEEAALRRMVDHLWQPDGSFVTFFIPDGRNDNQNFYPGEALLLWAHTIEAEQDPELLDRFMLSFDYYRTWHRDQPNPAFIPWHTMAYEKVWHVTGDAELRDFVFEMNDWLLEMQQWEETPAADVAGRFYNPERPDYGPPHASADGVYLESLIAAYRLAVAADDDDRAETYRIAVARGLRHLMQLQFADDVDMFYVSKRDRVAGGLRTTVYDNRIRVDNVQHGLLAVMDTLEVFAPGDYVISPP